MKTPLETYHRLIAAGESLLEENSPRLARQKFSDAMTVATTMLRASREHDTIDGIQWAGLIDDAKALLMHGE